MTKSVPGSSDPEPVGKPALLTDAERVILMRLLAGYSNSDIAKERATSVRTVANQIARIYRKFGVSSRRELAARQREFGEFHPHVARLQPKERLAIEYAMCGWSDKSIADELGRSTSSVGALLTRVRRKLQLSRGVLVCGAARVTEDSASTRGK